MSEIAPRKYRGTLVSCYQFCITIGLLLASCVCYATKDRHDSGSYIIPIALQALWALILGVGLFFLPESPRYWVRRGDREKAKECLIRLRGQTWFTPDVDHELTEIVASQRHELDQMPQGNYFTSWLNCFRGSILTPSSNVRRTILGTSLQMMQQWTGVNFVFYFGTTFFQSLGTITNPFMVSLVTTLVNVLSTPFSFYAIDKFGRRPLLIWGALGMVICQLIVAAVGTATDQSSSDVKIMISFICIYIFFFASTWGPGAWVVIGETFPLPIRARGVALSTASNWLWNCIIGVITPYMVGKDKGNLGAKVFFIWGSLCLGCLAYAYFLVFETKGLTLEQVDRMMEDCTPRTSASWRAQSTHAAQMIIEGDKLDPAVVEEVERQGSKV
jgi:SP family sugar:H+ symporter-like MFS transporter